MTGHFEHAPRFSLVIAGFKALVDAARAVASL
jgi:hypothetical protein